MKVQEEIAELEKEVESSESHTKTAYKKGMLNIYKEWQEKDIEDVEAWIHERKQSAQSITNGNQLDAHMLGHGEVYALEQIEKEIDVEKPSECPSCGYIPTWNFDQCPKCDTKMNSDSQ